MAFHGAAFSFQGINRIFERTSREEGSTFDGYVLIQQVLIMSSPRVFRQNTKLTL
jgi:hypothetical protein